ncbi:GNAT family N-acetyltransferase [Candidatus Saccharibacteria bacterium]|nr:GNAT family N-acetyltransferase [Candidatus Saccharibacteria bacterium]
MTSVERLSFCERDDVEQLGKLALELTEKFEGRQIDKKLLRDIMDSPSHDLLVARDKLAQPVGMATMSLIMGPVAGRIAYLEDFVVSEAARGQHVGGALWLEIENWSREQGAKRIEWTCNPSREAAHGFYMAKGAQIRETDVFRLEL